MSSPCPQLATDPDQTLLAARMCLERLLRSGVPIDDATMPEGSSGASGAACEQWCVSVRGDTSPDLNEIAENEFEK